jgi:glutathione S-transferase
MLLYQDPRAPNPRRVRVFLAEKGVAFDTVDVMLATSAHLTPEYLQKHPLGLLPVLELPDGRVLRESVAICRYVDELHPEPNLLGRDPWERAQVEQWNRHAEFELLLPIGAVFRNAHDFWKGRIPQSPEYAEIMRGVVRARMAWFDRELADRPFVAGDRFSIADITTRCALDFGKVIQVRVGDDTPHLRRWYDAMSERPSFKA